MTHLLKLTREGALLLAPIGHMRPDRVLLRMMPGLVVSGALLVGMFLLSQQGQFAWASVGVYLAGFMAAVMTLIISLTTVFARGTEKVPTAMKDQVLELALHGGRGKSKRSSAIQISAEQNDLIRDLIRANDQRRQADVILADAERQRVTPAPGLPETYRAKMLASEAVAVREANRKVQEAEQQQEAVRQRVAEYLTANDLDDETCEFWHNTWHKGKHDPRRWAAEF